jgi:hypothetical protein
LAGLAIPRIHPVLIGLTLTQISEDEIREHEGSIGRKRERRQKARGK